LPAELTPDTLAALNIAREPEMREPWASVDEVAKHLGVAKDSIYRWIEARALPAHKIGRLWKFKLSEVDEWVRAGGAKNRERSASKKTAKAKRGRS
jgi:excisionase family DNA binding protein